MKAFSLIMLLWLNTSRAALPEQAKADSVWSAVQSALGQGDRDAALKALQTIDVQSPFYPWSLLESARLLYETSQWKAFFGITYYARHVFPQARETEEIRLLESLALLRHCRYPEMERVLIDGKFTKEREPQANFLREVVLLSSQVGIEIPVDKEKRKTIMPRSQMWPIPAGHVEMLDPHKLRRAIPPLCKGPEVELGVGSEMMVVP